LVMLTSIDHKTIHIYCVRRYFRSSSFFSVQTSISYFLVVHYFMFIAFFFFLMFFLFIFFFFFFFNDTATTEIYTLSLHDALPIPRESAAGRSPVSATDAVIRAGRSP